MFFWLCGKIIEVYFFNIVFDIYVINCILNYELWIMGDEMLSVFYSGDIFFSYGKISIWGVMSLKVSFDEKSEFCFFKDYFGLIWFV